MKRKLRIAAAALALLMGSGAAHAEIPEANGLTLKMGYLDLNDESSLHKIRFSQKIEIKNHRSEIVKMVEVRCGVFANNELIDVPVAIVINIPPGQSGYGEIDGYVRVKPEKFDCRIDGGGE